MVQGNPSVDVAMEPDEETLARSEAVTLIECLRAVVQKLETGTSGTVPSPQTARVSGGPPPLPPPSYELKRLRSQITAVEEDFNVLQSGLAAVLEQAVGTVRGDLSIVKQEGDQVRSDIEVLKQQVAAAAARTSAETAIRPDKRISSVLVAVLGLLVSFIACGIAATASSEAAKASGDAAKASGEAAKASGEAAKVLKNGFVVEVKSNTKPVDACTSQGGTCLIAFMNSTPVGCEAGTPTWHDKMTAVCSRGP